MKIFYLLLVVLLINTTLNAQNVAWFPHSTHALETLKEKSDHANWTKKVNHLDDILNKQTRPNCTARNVGYRQDGHAPEGRNVLWTLDLSNNNLNGEIPNGFSLFDDPALSTNDIWQHFTHYESKIYFSYNNITKVTSFLLWSDNEYMHTVCLDHNGITEIDFYNHNDWFKDDLSFAHSLLEKSSMLNTTSSYRGCTVLKLNHNELTHVTTKQLAVARRNKIDNTNAIDMLATEFRIDNNRLSFNSLLPIQELVKESTKDLRDGRTRNGHCNFQAFYLPQKAIGKKVTSETMNAGVSKTLSFSIENAHADNIYTWTLNGKEVPFSNTNDYFINSFDETKAGVWRCQITNPGMPEAKLYSQDMALFLNKTGNKKPTAINLGTTKALKDAPFGNIITQISGTDPDNDQLFFRLNDDVKDNSSFRIINGNLLVTADKLFEYDYKQSYTIEVEAYDIYGGTFTKEFTITKGEGSANISIPRDITITDVATIEENTTGSIVGKVKLEALKKANDYATHLTLTDVTNDYILTLEPDVLDNNYFEIVSKNQIKVKSAFDFESGLNAPSVRVKCVSSDNVMTFYQEFSFIVSDVNETPTEVILPLKRTNINLPIGTIVSPIIGLDPDAGDKITIELTDKTTADNSDFVIIDNIVKTNRIFTEAGSKIIKVRAFDTKGLEIVESMTLSIVDPDIPTDPANTEAPQGIGFDNMILSTTFITGSKISNLYVKDVDGGNNYTWTITNDENTQGDYFKIDGDELKLAKELSENINSYNVNIEVSDGEYTFTGTYLFYKSNIETSASGLKTSTSEIKTYPNPFSNHLKLMIENDYFGQVDCELYNVAGTKIQQVTFNKSQRILKYQLPFTNVQSGMYIVRCIMGNEVKTIKVRKQ